MSNRKLKWYCQSNDEQIFFTTKKINQAKNRIKYARKAKERGAPNSIAQDDACMQINLYQIIIFICSYRSVRSSYNHRYFSNILWRIRRRIHIFIFLLALEENATLKRSLVTGYVISSHIALICKRIRL